MKNIKEYLVNESINISSEQEAINMINAAFKYLCKDLKSDANIALEAACNMKFKDNGSPQAFTTARIVSIDKSEDKEMIQNKFPNGVKYVLQCANVDVAKSRRRNWG